MLQKFKNPPDIDRPALIVRRATHAYGAARALDGVSLSVDRGEIYCLLGPNGAGKSTLLRAICGRQDLDSGGARIDGRFSPRDAAARQLIGYVPQDIALYRHLTVRENLDFFARMSGLSGTSSGKAVRRILARAALEAEADRITGTLSGGYQRRVNIAAAALTMPYLLVLDEPTVGIDVQAREAIHALLKLLRDQGTAILFTTHDLEQAQFLADRIGILKAGALILEGEPDDLLYDAFGSSKELIVELYSPPGPRKVALLEAFRLHPTQSPTTWFAGAPPKGLDAAAFTDDLADAGLDVREVRIRKPDLTSLFIKTVGAPELS